MSGYLILSGEKLALKLGRSQPVWTGSQYRGNVNSGIGGLIFRQRKTGVQSEADMRDKFLNFLSEKFKGLI